MDWMQVGAFIVAVLGLGLAGVVYVTRQLNRQFDRIYDRFDQIDARFVQVDARFVQIDARFVQIDARMARIEERLGAVEQAQVGFDERLVRVENIVTANQRDIRSLNENVQNLEIEQARMLGFLEGRGVMGKAPPEPERAS